MFRPEDWKARKTSKVTIAQAGFPLRPNERFRLEIRAWPNSDSARIPTQTAVARMRNSEDSIVGAIAP
ncbi:MAG: hypothetical protein RLZ37_1476 [Actinomycetota bacterium]|jgi:hypothetical protein